MSAVANLQVSTPSDREIVMTRAFDAPRARVYAALTTPELLKNWLSVRGLVMDVATTDPRPGGRYRLEGGKPGAPRIGWGGVIREVVPNERIVQTEAFDGYPGEALNTTTLDERDGKTTLTVTVEYPSKEIRDAVLATGMTDGAAEAYDRLQALVRS